MPTILAQKKLFLLITLFFISGYLLIKPPQTANATLESCTASLTPHTVTTSIQQNFTVTLTNTGSNPILYFRITSPSDAFTIQGKSATGWSSTSNSSYAEFWGGSVAVGASFDFTLSIKAGESETDSANWVVIANDALSSSGTTTCTGDTGIAITGVADVIGPVLSELITVSSINVSSANIAWTTDELSTSVVSYGTTESLGSTESNSTLTLSHSVSLSSLSSGTTYYFNVSSADESGNTTESSQGTFTTTAEEILTVTEAAETTVTIVVTPTPTPSPTPVPVDRTPPRVIIETDLDTPFEISPIIKGRATDNKIITNIEYSTDGGNNWLPVDEIENIDTNKTNFEFIPFLNEDGNYPIRVRAKDKRGNIGKSTEVILIIDRLPPLVGGNLISMGPQALMPNANGTVIALAGIEQKITLSAIGGPTSIDLFVGKKKIPLEYSPETSLWFGFLDLDEIGTYTLTAKAIDGAKNKTTRELNKIQIIGSGKIISEKTNSIVNKGKISVFTKDHQTQQWNLWDGQAFGQENPQKIGANGTYQFFLPPGTYYFQVESAGFNTTKSQIFTLKQSKPINANFKIGDGRVVKLGPIKIPLPSFLQKTTQVDISLPEVKKSDVESLTLINQAAPSFSLSNNQGEFKLADLRGQTSIISFISTWSPPAIEQISIISKLVDEESTPITMISTQETNSKVTIFNQRGSYKTPIWVDPDGELIEKYQLTTLPTHFVLDRRGKIIQILTQVLNEEQLLTLLSVTD